MDRKNPPWNAPANPLPGLLNYFFGPYARSASAAGQGRPVDTKYRNVIGSIPSSANGESYRRAELRLADAARPGGGGGGGGNAGYSLPSPGFGTAPIIQGTRDGVTADRTQSDEYRAQLGQYEALQKKKQYDEADALGMQIWQQKYGKTPMAGPESRNPLMQSTFGYQSFERPSFEGQAPVSLEDSFSVAANAVPAPWNRQGAMVDLNRGAPELFAKQAEKTNPMNAFSQGEGISGAVKQFLGRMGR